jgi:hypothetical protein
VSFHGWDIPTAWGWTQHNPQSRLLFHADASGGDFRSFVAILAIESWDSDGAMEPKTADKALFDGKPAKPLEGAGWALK